MRAERSARVFRRRNKPTYTQIGIIRRFSSKLSDISLQFEILRRLKALFNALCVQNVAHSARPASKQAPDKLNLQ